MSLPGDVSQAANNQRPPASSHAAITCRGLTKRYKLGAHRGLRETINRLGGRTRVERLNAIDDLSLDITAGECTGLIGGNGSGKSTFLQIVAGITVPTAGSAEIRGRVLPLLALGTGFHPELTGQENIFLFGAVLRIPRSVIRRQVRNIADFAEIAQHLDTPTKRYSDGMRARLSFAIAMRFPADIYLFDEVLAIADEDFRNRCLIEIEKLVATGRTVLFVSHDSTLIERLCRTVVWLDHGRVRMAGDTAEVLPEYRFHSRTSNGGTGRVLTPKSGSLHARSGR